MNEIYLHSGNFTDPSIYPVLTVNIPNLNWGSKSHIGPVIELAGNVMTDGSEYISYTRGNIVLINHPTLSEYEKIWTHLNPIISGESLSNHSKHASLGISSLSKKNLQKIASELNSYMEFRSVCEGLLKYELNSSFFLQSLRIGVSCFFGVQVDENGMVCDLDCPEIWNLWNQMGHRPPAERTEIAMVMVPSYFPTPRETKDMFVEYEIKVRNGDYGNFNFNFN